MRVQLAYGPTYVLFGNKPSDLRIWMIQQKLYCTAASIPTGANNTHFNFVHDYLAVGIKY